MFRYFLLISLLWGSAAIAQPVLDARYMPSEGLERWEIGGSRMDTFSIAKGAQQTWNLDLSGDTNQSTHFVYRTTQGLTVNAAYGNPTLCAYRFYQTSLQDSVFYSVKDSAFRNNAFTHNYGTERSNFYLPSRSLLPFNLPLLGQRIDTSRQFYIKNGRNVLYYTYIDTIQYLGYGTLVLNGQVYPEAVLMWFSNTELDSTSTPTVFQISSYRWFVPAIGEIARIVVPHYDRQSFYSRYTFRTRINAPVSTFRNHPSVTLPFPNPTNGKLRFPWKGSTVRVLSSQGKEYIFPVEHGSVSVESLPPGYYLLNAGSTEGPSSSFIKQ